MNETINILMNRSSVRVYQDKPIEKDILDSILKAGLASASAGNLQPVSIIKIENKINSQWFVDHHTQALVGKAPLNLLFCLDFHRLKKWSANHKAPFVMLVPAGDKQVMLGGSDHWGSHMDIGVVGKQVQRLYRREFPCKFNPAVCKFPGVFILGRRWGC